VHPSAKADWLALDTEFIREKTYYPQLCLIQVATEEEIACIDRWRWRNSIRCWPCCTILPSPKFFTPLSGSEIFFHLRGAVRRRVRYSTGCHGIGYGEQIGYPPWSSAAGVELTNRKPARLSRRP